MVMKDVLRAFVHASVRGIVYVLAPRLAPW
jgi:hypothetical protein